MKRLKIGFAKLTLLLCFSCITENASLGNGYFLLTEHESADIGYPYGSTVYWSPSDSKNLTYRIINSEIINCWHDNNYIIVQQRINLKLLKAQITDGIIRAFNYDDIDSVDVIYKKIGKQDFSRDFNFPKEGQKNIEQANFIADSLIESNVYFLSRTKRKYNYYIINKNKRTVSDPLSLTEMQSEVNKYNIQFKNFK